MFVVGDLFLRDLFYFYEAGCGKKTVMSRGVLSE